MQSAPITQLFITVTATGVKNCGLRAGQGKGV